jgi:hypothetical protein
MEKEPEGEKQKTEKGKTWKPSPTSATGKSCNRETFLFIVI